MSACDLPSNLTDVHFTIPPAVFAPYREQPVSANSAPAQARWIKLSDVYFVLGNDVLSQGISGISNFAAAFFQAMQTKDIAIAELSQVWKRHLVDSHAISDVDALSETVEGVFEVISRFGPSAINLKHLDPNSIQGEHLAAVLRATAPWQEQTPGWNEAVQIAEMALRKSGIDPHDALVGLI
jgi:hypothetical protein